MTTTNPDDKPPLPGNVVRSLEEAPAALTGGPNLVPVIAYRDDGKKYLLQMSPDDAARGGFELLNPPPEPEPEPEPEAKPEAEAEAKAKPKPKAKKPKDKSRTKDTAGDKAAKDKTPKAGSK